MILRHRLAPERHGELGVGLLRIPERARRIVVLEVVELGEAVEECLLRQPRARVREGDLADLLRPRATGREKEKPEAERQPQKGKTHKPIGQVARPARPYPTNPPDPPDHLLLDEQHLAIGRAAATCRAGSMHLELRRRSRAAPSIAGTTASRKCLACFSAAPLPSCSSAFCQLVGPLLAARRSASTSSSSSLLAFDRLAARRLDRRHALRRPASGTRAPPAGCSGSPSAPSAALRRSRSCCRSRP